MSKTRFILNEKSIELAITDDRPLLWLLRDDLNLTGTKYGCGKGLCGACTVHYNGNALRACSIPARILNNDEITTIEGLNNPVAEQLKKAWVELNVPQCGYCQPGQLMSAAALLNQNPSPSEKEVETAMQGNICRCGTYIRIKKAIALTVERLANNKEQV